MNQPYELYKPSGIDWIGNIPSIWEVKKLKYLLESVFGGGTPSTENESFWNGEYPWVSPKDMKSDVITKTEDTITELAIKNSSTSLIPERSVLVVVRSGILKHTLPIAINAIPVTLNQDMKALIPNDLISSNYLSLLLKGYQHNILSQCSKIGATVDSIEMEWFINYDLPIPPLAEQRAITTYLDRKTAQIDDLVARKEQLLALLQQKRQAIINEAVTRGLDLNAPKKNSGIEWLGEIPSHWKLKKLRYEISFLTDYTANGSFADLAKNVEYLEEGYSRLVRLTDLRENLQNAGLYVSESAHKYLSKSELFGGEILLANVGAYSGLAWKMPFIDGKATLAPNMFMLRFKPSMNEDFAYYALISDYLHGQLKNKAISSAQPKLNKEDVRSTILVLPPIDEQQEIVKYIDKATEKIEKVASAIKAQLTYFKAYRQSLISEVVTGKIDVRAKVTADV